MMIFLDNNPTKSYQVAQASGWSLAELNSGLREVRDFLSTVPDIVSEGGTARLSGQFMDEDGNEFSDFVMSITTVFSRHGVTYFSNGAFAVPMLKIIDELAGEYMNDE